MCTLFCVKLLFSLAEKSITCLLVELCYKILQISEINLFNLLNNIIYLEIARRQYLHIYHGTKFFYFLHFWQV